MPETGGEVRFGHDDNDCWLQGRTGRLCMVVVTVRPVHVYVFCVTHVAKAEDLLVLEHIDKLHATVVRHNISTISINILTDPILKWCTLWMRDVKLSVVPTLHVQDFHIIIFIYVLERMENTGPLGNWWTSLPNIFTVNLILLCIELFLVFCFITIDN